MKHILPTCLLYVAFTTLAALPVTAKSAEIKNDSVWKDDRGEEIMCQGGNLAKFGDTFYFYGWGDYPGDNRKDTITCYSSKDLATWKFERHVATYGKNGFNIIPDRLHVLFNEATRKYVMITKHRLPYRDPDIPDNRRTAGEIGFADCDTPTGDFVMRGHERPKSSSAEWYAYGDLCAFKDTDGKAYVVSAGTGQKCFFVLQLTPDYMHYEKMLCKIPGNHEAPYMVRMNGKYWIFASGVAGWSSSGTYFTTATNPAGPWSAYKEVTTEPESKDSFNSQSDLLFEVKGSAGSFVLWGADRWSQRTKIGVGKNVWLPLEWKGDEPVLNWHPTWNVDAAAGTWTTPAKSTATSANEIKPWTVGTTSGRQHLVTPDGKPFLILGLSHASGAWQGLLGPRKHEAMEKLRTDLRDLKFNATGYVPELGVEFNYIHNADRLPGSPGTVTGQGQRKHLYEDVFDPTFHARLRKHIQGIADKTAKDAHCIGYWWTDIPVWNPGQQKQKFGLSYVDFIRALPEGAAGRVRYESWKKVNAAAKDDAFHVLIARELYRATAAAYREFAPGKLIFSERYNTIPGAPLEIIAEAGKVVDVISFQPYEKTLKGDILDQVHAMTGKPIILSDWSLSFPVAGHDNTMWPQFPTPAEAAAAYEAYLTSAFAKPYILGYYKCQYRDAILPTGQLKQGLRTVDGELRKDWAQSIARIHQSLLATFKKEESRVR